MTVAFIKHTTKYYSGNSLSTAQTQSVDIACMSWYWWTFFMTLYFRLGDSRKLFFLITSFSLCLEKCVFFTWLNAGGIPQSQSKDVPVLSVLGQLCSS